MKPRILIVLWLLVLGCLSAPSLLHGQADQCAHIRERVGGTWLTDLDGFPESIRGAAHFLAEQHRETAADYLVTVEQLEDRLVFHLWHRSAFEAEHCGQVGNPGGLCRDIHLMQNPEGVWKIVAIYFWQ